jgi:outer membrane protein OmpA-like peptidoglycan-associated protein
VQKNVKEYLVALGLNEKDIIACKGKGRIIRTPIPGELGIYKDRKVMIITERSAKKAAPPAPKPTPAPAKQEVAKTEAPKPVAAKVEPPKPAPAPSAPAKPVSAPSKTLEVKRKPEKDLATLDPAKLAIDEIIPLNNIFFAPGSNAMLRKSQTALEQLYKFLADNPDISIEIQGHICCLDPADGTDEPDGLGGNRSEGRAKNIYIYLVSKGVDKGRMKFVGLGNKKPAVFPERTEFDRELNRRATIRIISK